VNPPESQDPSTAAVLGQKYAFATASLLVGIASFVQLLGMERAILAILFGWLALRRSPGPPLVARRTWAKVGIALGVAMAVLVPLFLGIYWDRVRELIEALESLQ
jgi:hypothetical protein